LEFEDWAAFDFSWLQAGEQPVSEVLLSHHPHARMIEMECRHLRHTASQAAQSRFARTSRMTVNNAPTRSRRLRAARHERAIAFRVREQRG
jgi:hypothetical protein